MPRVRSDGGDLEPDEAGADDDDALRADARFATIARLSANDAQVVAPVAAVRAGNRQSHRIGAGRDQQRAEACARAARSARTVRAPTSIDATRVPSTRSMRRSVVELRRSQRNPVFLRLPAR